MWSIPGIGERSSASAAMVSRATWWWQDFCAVVWGVLAGSLQAAML